MTPRSIRRAAERKANKLARKAALNNQTSTIQTTTVQAAAIEPAAIQSPAVELILPAVGTNAHLTTVASPLTGQSMLLPMTDAPEFAKLLNDYQTELQPVGLQESNLVQTLAETRWRARRSLALEMALFARGRVEFAEQFANQKPEIRESLIELHTFLTYEKQIRTLQLQEDRLTRRAEKAYAELRTLQSERRERERADQQRQLEAAARLYETAQQNQQTFEPDQFGFEFSNHEIDAFLSRKQAAKDHLAAVRNRRMRPEAA